MKNWLKVLEAMPRIAAMRSIAIIAMVAVIGFSMTACGGDDDNGGGGGGGGNSALNGTWVNGTDKTVLNNGAITMSSNNVEMMKGTYSTSGNNITVTFTQVKAAMFGEDASDMGLSPDQWYTQQQLKAAIIKILVDEEGVSQSEAEEMYEEWGISEAFESTTGTYTLSGNTLTVTMEGTSTVLTRQ